MHRFECHVYLCNEWVPEHLISRNRDTERIELCYAFGEYRHSRHKGEGYFFHQCDEHENLLQKKRESLDEKTCM